MNVIVIGAGPAGMMCAGTAKKNGVDVLLIERNNKVGRKLMITGKGRCNVTNNCEPNDFIRNIPTNGHFMYSCVNKFKPMDTILFFEGNGCKLKTERGRRVFPQSDRAEDIVDTLRNFVISSGVKLKKARAIEIIVKGKGVEGVRTTEGQFIKSDCVVIACGGKSYPGTGSSGDGYNMASDLGHTIIKPKPSLVPLTIKQDFCKDLQGLSLKNISIDVFDKRSKKNVYSDFGEMLFTHFGVSGPVILSASSHMREINPNKYSIIIDLKPALTFEQLDLRILKDLSKNIHKDFSNSLYELLPKRIIPTVISLSGIYPNIKCDNITKEMRRSFANVLKGITLDVDGVRPINEAIVTSGGVCTKEINPSTMESKLVGGLFFAGEVIDVDGYTGGFNLQIAFSTGYTAAMGLANKL